MCDGVIAMEELLLPVQSELVEDTEPMSCMLVDDGKDDTDRAEKFDGTVESLLDKGSIDADEKAKASCCFSALPLSSGNIWFRTSPCGMPFWKSTPPGCRNELCCANISNCS